MGCGGNSAPGCIQAAICTSVFPVNMALVAAELLEASVSAIGEQRGTAPPPL